MQGLLEKVKPQLQVEIEITNHSQEKKLVPL